MAKRPQSRRRAATRRRRYSHTQLLELLQRESFRYFWEGAHPVSGLACDRRARQADAPATAVVTGGSGFGMLALLVACQRRWVRRAQCLARFHQMLDFLEQAPRYHGMYPHLMRADTGATITFAPKDDGADLVETAFLFQGLLCARAYFAAKTAAEIRLRARITRLWQAAEWDWFVQPGRRALTWHWSPNYGFAINNEVRGWNECLIAYVMATGAPRHAVPATAYHEGWALGADFLNGKRYEDIALPLGPSWGGPLFFAHFSFCGLDPGGLADRYANYEDQCLAHTRINYAYCVRNPHNYRGYGPACWGLSASESIAGYAAHAPDNDLGVITPAAALASFAYAPREAMAALRHFYEGLGDRIWGRFGFVDAFSEQHGWTADTYVAINQGPLIAMVENYRSGLIWKLFMRIPEIQAGLQTLGFRRAPPPEQPGGRPRL
jgi:hypothetical protein